MKKIIVLLIIGCSLMFLSISPAIKAASPLVTTFAKSASECQKGSFFGLPTWYKYQKFDNNCGLEITTKVVDADGNVDSSLKIEAIWLIIMAILEMLLTVAGFLAVIFVIAGGYKLVMAQGAPDKIANARNTIYNALIGTVIAIIASQIVAFIAGKLS